jgi:predicted lipid-binding transport protein (Tim44 family)
LALAAVACCALPGLLSADALAGLAGVGVAGFAGLGGGLFLLIAVTMIGALALDAAAAAPASARPESAPAAARPEEAADGQPVTRARLPMRQDKPAPPPEATAGDSSRWASVITSLAAACFWAVLAVRSPTVTYHLAPMLVAPLPPPHC